MPQSSATSAHGNMRTEAAYSRWAPIYDLIFDLPFHPGRLAAAQAAAAAAGPDGAMLVVGVGTGLELELLPRDLHASLASTSARRCSTSRTDASRADLHDEVRGRLVMDAGATRFFIRRRAFSTPTLALRDLQRRAGIRSGQ